MTARPLALVIGAGVIGLTTGIRLLEAGWRVEIHAEHLPAETTSVAAGALCGLAFAEPMTKVPGWEAATQRELSRMVTAAGTGVHVERGLLASRSAVEPPPPLRALPGFAVADARDLPAGFAGGFWLRMPVVDMPRHMRYLAGRFERSGGVIAHRRVAALSDVTGDVPAVVNCAGSGARALTGDVSLTASRGQHVVVANPGIDHFFMEGPPGASTWASYVPHGDEVVLGGVAAQDDWDTTPDPVVARHIIDRCAAIDPRLADARVIGHRVGLRPQRPAVRVDAETIGATRVIHNYGHGGLGVTLSWGCADEVVALLAGVPAG
jgi:D-amino-acid oxidase